jgi:hypothetical protein
MRIENRARKCNQFVNVTKVDLRQNVRLTPDISSRPTQSRHFQSDRPLIRILIQEYGNWVQQQTDNGWDAYLFSFLFHQLPGSREAKIQQMNRDIERWYGRLATRSVRKPRSPHWAPLLPKGIFESWSRKSEQGDKWSFCLTAGTLCPANQEKP